MYTTSRFVRFGFALIGLLLMVGLIYAGVETPESELAALTAQLGIAVSG